MGKRRVSLIALAALASVLFTPSIGNATTERISVASDGTQSEGGGWHGLISADGRFVLFSSASKLDAGDTNLTSDAFVHVRATGVTERVSVSSGGLQGDKYSQGVAISADGRFVLFSSSATNLVTGDTNGRDDAFVRDRAIDTTELVSISPAGSQGVGNSKAVAISADGRFVLFSMDGSGVFVRDRQSGITESVLFGVDGTLGWATVVAALSGDGRFILFSSNSSHLVSGETNVGVNPFVRDRQTGLNERVSAPAGVTLNSGFLTGDFSPDGRYVVFTSGAQVLGATMAVFVRDRQIGITELIGVAERDSGAEWNFQPAISANGRYVAFVSTETNLVPGDTNGVKDTFLFDRETGITERIGLAPDGSQGDAGSRGTSMSADGRYVVIDSESTNLVDGDTNNGGSDVFVVEFLMVPVAASDNYSTQQQVPLVVPTPGVLANDTNPVGDSLSAVLVTETAHGTLVMNADGSFTYTPEAGFAGEDSFTYRARNGEGDSNPVTAAISVLVPQVVKLTVPNGGQSWRRGTARTIKWTSPVTTGTVTLRLFIAGTNLIGDIATNAANTGFYSWTVPRALPALGKYRILVILNDNPSVSDSSDRNFTLN